MKNYIALDIGSKVTKIYMPQAGVVLSEPTLLAISESHNKIISYGNDAKELQGKSTENVKFVCPVEKTEIKEKKLLGKLLKYFFNKLQIEKSFIKPKILFSVQCGIEPDKLKEFENLFTSIGYYDVSFVESPVLSLLGTEAPVTATNPSFVIDFGAGQTTIAAITLNGVISGLSADISGISLNGVLQTHIEEELQLKLSLDEVERIKLPLASLEEEDQMTATVSGKDSLSGKSKSVLISAETIYAPLKNYVDTILNLALKLFDNLSEKSKQNIKASGIYLTGGGANIFGLSDYASKYLNIKCVVPDSPELCCITGAGIVSEDNELLKKLKLQ